MGESKFSILTKSDEGGKGDQQCQSGKHMAAFAIFTACVAILFSAWVFHTTRKECESLKGEVQNHKKERIGQNELRAVVDEFKNVTRAGRRRGLVGVEDVPKLINPVRPPPPVPSSKIPTHTETIGKAEVGEIQEVLLKREDGEKQVKRENGEEKIKREQEGADSAE